MPGQNLSEFVLLVTQFTLVWLFRTMDQRCVLFQVCISPESLLTFGTLVWELSFVVQGAMT